MSRHARVRLPRASHRSARRRRPDVGRNGPFPPSAQLRRLNAELAKAHGEMQPRRHETTKSTLAFFVSSCFRGCLQHHQELLCGLRVERDLLTISEATTGLRNGSSYLAVQPPSTTSIAPVM